MSKTIFITGATSGFGKATAEIFAKNGYNIIITGRRKEKLNSLSKKLKSKHGIDVISLCFDVRNNNEVVRAINSLPNKKIDVLINNAGLASGLNKIQWNVNNLPNGIYLLNVKSNNSISTKKIIINK